MNIRLKRAAPGQIDQVIPFVASYHEFEGIKQSDRVRHDAVNQLLVHTECGGIWLVLDDDLPVGYVALCKGFSIEFGGFDAFVDELYIDETHRGKGVGKQVLELIKPEARRLGILALHLEVARDNTRARKLYASLGFEGREKYLLMSATTRL